MQKLTIKFTSSILLLSFVLFSYPTPTLASQPNKKCENELISIPYKKAIKRISELLQSLALETDTLQNQTKIIFSLNELKKIKIDTSFGLFNSPKNLSEIDEAFVFPAKRLSFFIQNCSNYDLQISAIDTLKAYLRNHKGVAFIKSNVVPIYVQLIENLELPESVRLIAYNELDQIALSLRTNTFTNFLVKFRSTKKETTKNDSSQMLDVVMDKEPISTNSTQKNSLANLEKELIQKLFKNEIGRTFLHANSPEPTTYLTRNSYSFFQFNTSASKPVLLKGAKMRFAILQSGEPTWTYIEGIFENYSQEGHIAILETSAGKKTGKKVLIPKLSQAFSIDSHVFSILGSHER